jgi:hypothetical protein
MSKKAGGTEIKWAPSASVHLEDVNLIGNNIHTIKKNTDTLSGSGMEVGLVVNTEKTKCMLLPCHQNEGQNQSKQIAESITRPHCRRTFFCIIKPCCLEKA